MVSAAIAYGDLLASDGTVIDNTADIIGRHPDRGPLKSLATAQAAASARSGSSWNARAGPTMRVARPMTIPPGTMRAISSSARGRPMRRRPTETSDWAIEALELIPRRRESARPVRRPRRCSLLGHACHRRHAPAAAHRLALLIDLCDGDSGGNEQWVIRPRSCAQDVPGVHSGWSVRSELEASFEIARGCIETLSSPSRGRNSSPISARRLVPILLPTLESRLRARACGRRRTA